MISFKSSFENTNDVVLDPNILLYMAASVAQAAPINPNGTKTLLAKCLSIFTIKGKPFFSNGSRSLPRNCPNCTILDSWVFKNFMLSDEPFGKA